MKFILFISNITVPLVFLGIVAYGYLNKVSLFDTFIEGAKDGIKTVFNILPTLIGLMVAVGVIRASGALALISRAISPLTSSVGFPSEAVPLAFLRLISSSAATGLALDLFKNYGPDSFIGRFISIMMSCTETVFYTMSVYFMSINIKKTKYTLPGALIANIAGIIASLYITIAIFGK